MKSVNDISRGQEKKICFEQPNRLQRYLIFYMGFCVGINMFSHGIKKHRDLWRAAKLRFGIEVFCRYGF